MRVLILFLLIPLASHAIERKNFRINDFSCGLVLGQGYDQGSTVGRVAPGCSRDASNVYFSKKNGSVISREQYMGENTTAVNSNSNATVQWGADFSDNSQDSYALVRSSQVMAQCSGNAPMSCTTISGVTLNSTTPIQGIVTLNRAWFVGGGTTPFSIDRNFAVTFNARAPRGTLIGAYRNRLLISGAPGAESTLYLSGQDNAEDWTLGSQTTSPVTFTAGGSDNPEIITCLMGNQDGVFRVGTIAKLFSLVGVDQDDLRLIEAAQVGCRTPRAATIFPDGAMIWLGNDGFYELVGNSLKLISGNIKTLAERIAFQGLSHVKGDRIRNFTSGDHKGDYWFSYIIAAAAGYTDNNSVLVYERPSGNWTQFTGINASSFFTYGTSCNALDAFHFGNSNGDGIVYAFGIQGNTTGGASVCAGTREPAFQASFELWPFDAGDPSVLKAFETAYVVTHSTPHEFFAPYDPMQTRVVYTMDSSFADSNSEIFIGTMTQQNVTRLQATRINLSQSGVGSIPKGRWISLGFSSTLQRNPLIIEDLIFYYTVLGRL